MKAAQICPDRFDQSTMPIHQNFVRRWFVCSFGAMWLGAQLTGAAGEQPLAAQGNLSDAQAKTLALKAHADAAAVGSLAKLYYRVKSGNGDVDTMRDRNECSFEGLMEALDGPVIGADWLQWEITLAWTERHALWGITNHEGGGFGEGLKNSRHDRVWTKELAYQRGEAPGRPVQFVFSRTPDRLWEGRQSELAYFRVTPRRFWWANSDQHTDVISPIPPAEADYRFVTTEQFDDEICDVVESPLRAERLWIGRSSGRLRGILIFHYKGGGPAEPFYRNERVTKIAGKTFATREEFNAWQQGNLISPTQKTEISRVWSQLYFDSYGPNELIRFRDYREVAPGVWVPFREDRAFTHPAQQNPKRHKYIRLWVAVQEAHTDIDLADRVQSLQPREGDRIQDQRFEVIVNYTYRAGRTQSELLELIDAERRKQAADAEIVKRITAPIAVLVGQPAPALPETGWLGGPKPEFAGRPCLIHFWATWCGPCKNDLPRLKALAAEGIPIIGLHPAAVPATEIEKAITDGQLGYPTWFAPPTTKQDERKIAGYPAGIFPYCILVDRAGRVADHGSLTPDLIAKLRMLMRGSD